MVKVNNRFPLICDSMQSDPTFLRHCYILVFSGLEISNLTLPRNVRMRSSSDASSHFKRRQFSTTELRKSQIIIGTLRHECNETASSSKLWPGLISCAVQLVYRIPPSFFAICLRRFVLRLITLVTMLTVIEARREVTSLRQLLFPLFCAGFCTTYSAGLMCKCVKAVPGFCRHRRWRGCRLWFILRCFCRLHDRTKLDHE